VCFRASFCALFALSSSRRWPSKVGLAGGGAGGGGAATAARSIGAAARAPAARAVTAATVQRVGPGAAAAVAAAAVRGASVGVAPTGVGGGTSSMVLRVKWLGKGGVRLRSPGGVLTSGSSGGERERRRPLSVGESSGETAKVTCGCSGGDGCPTFGEKETWGGGGRGGAVEGARGSAATAAPRCGERRGAELSSMVGGMCGVGLTPPALRPKVPAVPLYVYCKSKSH
jgi:hypothetical protein